MSKAWGKGSTTAWRKMRLLILARDNHTCRVQGPKCTHTATQVDHIIPKHAGGADDPMNLRAACSQCNLTREYSDNPKANTDWLAFLPEEGPG